TNSSQSYTGLAAGSHTFTVTATDTAGNPGSATHTWTIDTTAPTVTLASQPANPTSPTSASFGFSANNTISNGSCTVDGPGPAPSATSSSQSYSGLTAGSHTFTVTATDTAGNPGSATHTWTIDTTAPTVTLGSKPANPTSQTSASFSFSANKTIASWSCKLDGAAAAPCATSSSQSI